MNYDPFASTFSNSRKNLYWPELDAVIEDMKKREVTSVLDIGCGNGRFLERYEKQTPRNKLRYLGIDNSAGMIGEAQKLHPDYEFQVVPMESLNDGGGTNSYDVMVFLASFHHLDTREKRIQTLKHIRKFLTPDGRIYMTNWNLRDQEKYESMQTDDGEYQIKIGEHSRYYHGFTLDELAELFGETGYTVIENRIFEGGRNLYSIVTL